jgi:hypothetical protein
VNWISNNFRLLLFKHNKFIFALYFNSISFRIF